MNSKVVLGIIAGLATGALLGILFAPEKGSVTRKKLAEDGGLDGLKDKFNEFVGGIGDSIGSMKDSAEDTIDDVKEHVAEKRGGKKEVSENPNPSY